MSDAARGLKQKQPELSEEVLGKIRRYPVIMLPWLRACGFHQIADLMVQAKKELNGKDSGAET